jgi:hypothetical protein
LIFSAGAADLTNRSARVSTAQAGATATYTIKFDMGSATSISSISFSFCGNSPLLDEACIPPVGFDATATSLVTQLGEIGFSIHANSTASQIILTRPAQVVVPGTVSYQLNNITTPTSSGAYFLRVETFATDDATGPLTDFGGIALNNNDIVDINTTVPPYLLFCMGVTISGTDCNTASGDYVDFGELSTNTTRFGSTQMVVATNAADGYVVFLDGTTMLSGTNAIPALASNDVSRPGTSQFGINLRSNSDPHTGQNPVGAGVGAVKANYNIPNRYRFVTGEQLASAPTADAYRKYTVSYIINIAKDQAPGVYVSTITYTCTATF